jgi:hypothetical protein
LICRERGTLLYSNKEAESKTHIAATKIVSTKKFWNSLSEIAVTRFSEIVTVARSLDALS